MARSPIRGPASVYNNYLQCLFVFEDILKNTGNKSDISPKVSEADTDIKRLTTTLRKRKIKYMDRETHDSNPALSAAYTGDIDYCYDIYEKQELNFTRHFDSYTNVRDQRDFVITTWETIHTKLERYAWRVPDLKERWEEAWKVRAHILLDITREALAEAEDDSGFATGAATGSTTPGFMTSAGVEPVSPGTSEPSTPARRPSTTEPPSTSHIPPPPPLPASRGTGRPGASRGPGPTPIVAPEEMPQPYVLASANSFAGSTGTRAELFNSNGSGIVNVRDMNPWQQFQFVNGYDRKFIKQPPFKLPQTFDQMILAPIPKNTPKYDDVKKTYLGAHAIPSYPPSRTVLSSTGVSSHVPYSSSGVAIFRPASLHRSSSLSSIHTEPFRSVTSY